MADYNARRISEAELTVMEVLWDAAGPLSAKTLQEELKERRGWERTTVRSLLTRLAEKGSVTTEKTDVVFYTPAFTRSEYAWDLTEVLLDRMYGNSGKALCADLCAHGKVTAGDLDALERKLF